MNIRVGIAAEPVIEVCMNGPYRTEDGEEVVGDQTIRASAVGMLWNDRLSASLTFIPVSPSSTFTVRNVTIGIDFHWQRRQTQTFSGELHLVMHRGKVQVINVLPLEDYLLSVISSEMSATSSLQLLKAHAVISRSWAIGKINAYVKTSPAQKPEDVGKSMAYKQKPEEEDLTAKSLAVARIIRWYDTDSHRLFHVCADDHCQRYQGVANINPVVQQAIDETRGVVLMHDGQICDARFSKCCGGVMEEFQNCWQDTTYPYLVSKPDYIDDVRSNGVVDAFCNTQNKAVLRQVLNDYDQETNNFYRWTVEYTREELTQIIKQKSGIDFGVVTRLYPIQRGPSHRIVELHIVGTKQTVTVGKELEIRKWLSPTHLYSSAFDVEETSDGFRLHGRGWGHGVGLCQIGAAVMGDLGYDYKEILQHYYPNSELLLSTL